MPEITLPASAFLAVWGFLALNILTPGPNVLNTVTLAIGSGRRAGLGAALGTGAGFAVWSVGAMLGLAALLAAAPRARLGLSLLAAGLLVWFALRHLAAARAGFAARRRGAPASPPGRAGLGPGAGFARAVGVLMTNPKALTTWLAVAGLFPVTQAGPGDLALFCLGCAGLGAGIHAIYALVFSTAPAARAWLRAAPALNLGVGLFFLGFAARLALGALG